jgi:hypothetical protein
MLQQDGLRPQHPPARGDRTTWTRRQREQYVAIEAFFDTARTLDEEQTVLAPVKK